MTAGQRGFTLVELLVAATITLTVTGALLAAMSPADGIFSSELEAGDQQQRLRVSIGVFVKDLITANLVLPYRASRGADPPGTFRADAVTVVSSSEATATLANPLAAESGQARVNIGLGCPLIDSVCGLSRASTVLAADDTKSLDPFHVDDVQDTVLVLRHTMPDSPKIYAPGSRLVEAVVRSYFLKVDTSTDSVQLVRDDGNGAAAVPVVDHVVGLLLEYFSGAANTEPLDASALTDGPWLPDSLAPNRFDADLLRVRSIAVTLRVESALAALRGPAGPLFSRAGTSRRGSRFLPDFQMRVRVSPRNLGNLP